jgi:hypothetical protein
MPVLKNNRRELFAQLLFQGYSAVKAYEKAGYRRHEGNACTLANHPVIQARLEEIRSGREEIRGGDTPVGTRAIAARNKVTSESLVEMHRKLYDRAYESGGQLGAGVSAVKEISILTGHRVERAEIGGPGDFDHLTDDDLERLLVERLAQLGFALVPAISDGSIALNGAETDT